MKIDKYNHQEIINFYMLVKNINETCRKFKINYQMVRKIMRINNIKTIVKPDIGDEILKSYLELKNCTLVCDKLNLSYPTVTKYLKGKVDIIRPKKYVRRNDGSKKHIKQYDEKLILSTFKTNNSIEETRKKLKLGYNTIKTIITKHLGNIPFNKYHKPNDVYNGFTILSINRNEKKQLTYICECNTCKRKFKTWSILNRVCCDNLVDKIKIKKKSFIS